MICGRRKKGKHIVISAIEHYSVFHAATTLEKEGVEDPRIGVDKCGRVSPEDVEKNIRDDTILTSVTFASSEIRTVSPIVGVPLRKMSPLCEEQVGGDR